MKRCFLFGHRIVAENITNVLAKTIERYIVEYGVTEFIVGKYGDFDRLAAETVITLQQRYPQVRLTLLLPYHPAEQRVEIPAYFNASLYPSGMENVPRQFAIARANRYMVDLCDYLIVYLRYSVGNTQTLYRYAQKRAKNGNVQIEAIGY